MSVFLASCTLHFSEPTKNGELTPLKGDENAKKIVALETVEKINLKLFQSGTMDKMSLSFVAEKMLETNPDVEIFKARADQAKFGVEINQAKLWPTIDFKISGGPENVYKISGSTEGVIRKEASIAIKATLFDFGKRDKDIAQSIAAFEAAQLRVEDKADKILLDLTNAYLDVLESRDLARVTNQNIIQIHKFRNLVKANQEEGNASVADLNKVQARLENARASFVDLKANYETSRENFKKITDFYPVNLQHPPRLSAYEKANFATEEYRLKETKLELNAVRKDIEGLENKLSSIKAASLPVFRVGALADYKENISGTNDPISDYRLDFSVKYRLFDGGVNQAEQRRVLAQIREGQALLRKKTKNFEQDMRNADSEQIASAKKNALLAKRLSAARKVVNLNTEQFKEGVLTIFELLDAQAQLLSANKDLIQNRYQKYRVRYKQLQLADRLLTSLVAR